MKNNKIYTILIILCINLTSCSQSELPKNFKETEIPKENSEESRKLNYSQNEFQVKYENGILEVEKFTSSRNTELKIENGILKGFNHGEWGGKLTFQPNDKKEKEIEIKTGNVKFIFNYNNKIYFIEGIAHMSINEGFLYELQIEKNKFAYKKIIDFGDCPEAYTIFENTIYVASYQNFYQIENLKIELLYKDEFWGSLYPNSIALKSEEKVFVGIRGGIVELNLKTKTKKLYIPKE
ncbi:hypothetical protein BXU11_14010 [Flavobacterium sp. LM5]|uniref:hypothetical protein n=1 Tax=Flavobacterium sp. LM5 TaxID=1938610 RepID=UPI0009938081|nr:hypothetical protein [Flavobacterium sp. LM5]OOV25784.1 hypothetical protein BXU11_14010 [Flavobacterium sp. LM5]